jgi:hypothetical protein
MGSDSSRKFDLMSVRWLLVIGFGVALGILGVFAKADGESAN